MKKSPQSSQNYYTAPPWIPFIMILLAGFIGMAVAVVTNSVMPKEKSDDIPESEPAPIIIYQCDCNHDEPVQEDISIDAAIVSEAPPPEEVPQEPLTDEEQFNLYVDEICKLYTSVDPYLVKSMIWHESRYNPNCKSSAGAIGLMQIIPKWHKDRMNYHGVTDLTDPYGNILVGIDYLNDLYRTNGSDKTALVLMLYNMSHTKAYELYESGKISSYAQSVMDRAEKLRSGEIS